MQMFKFNAEHDEELLGQSTETLVRSSWKVPFMFAEGFKLT